MRVVSLVPSATETLLALGVRPVACTRFCDQRGIATVGGTKTPDVAAIVAAAADLVVVNDEENRREDAEALVRAGLTLHEMSPHSVADVGPAVERLAVAVGGAVPAPFGAREWRVWRAAQAAATPLPPRRSAVFVWRAPWMTAAPDTYGASVLSLLGLEVMDLRPGGSRYPEVTLDEVAEAGPEVVVLPSEPYPFAERHVGEVRDTIAGAEVRLVDGRDLFWWGARSPGAVSRLRRALGG